MKSPTLVLRIAATAFALLLAGATVRAEEKIPTLLPVPSWWPAAVRDGLAAKRAALEKRFDDFQTAAGVFNAKPGEKQTDAEYAALMEQRSTYIADAKAFNAEAKAAWRALVADAVRPVAEAMDAYARRLGWDPDKRRHLRESLDALELDRYTFDQEAIDRTWRDIRARGADPAIAQNAAQVRGLDLPGAGQQSFEDCAVFALANATGRPYSLVGALAAEAIRSGGWREAAERADPQHAIESRGLTGGEVILVAETYGTAEVVPAADFEQTLGEGRPILVNLRTAGGGAHEVVLTKAFPHAGETWFEVMDSARGPLERRYLTNRELQTLLRENGVVYRPAEHTVAPLLREPGS